MKSLRNIEPGRPAREGQLILQRRFALARDLFGGFAGCGRLLDLGCGNGAQTLYFAPEVRRLLGCDITPLQKTEGAAPVGSFDFLLADAGKLPIASGSIDLAVSFEVLEHLPDDLAAAKEVARILKPGGRFLFSVPNKWWIFESHGAAIPGFNWIPWNRVPFVGWLPRIIHESYARARIYTMARALKLCRQAGLEPVERGYITAPLDVLPDGLIRRFLRRLVFRNATTSNPFLAVNLFVLCRKPQE